MLENLRSLTALSDGRIAEVRIVTGIERGGTVQLIANPVIRMPYASLPWQRMPKLRVGRRIRAMPDRATAR